MSKSPLFFIQEKNKNKTTAKSGSPSNEKTLLEKLKEGVPKKETVNLPTPLKKGSEQLTVPVKVNKTSTINLPGKYVKKPVTIDLPGAVKKTTVKDYTLKEPVTARNRNTTALNLPSAVPKNTAKSWYSKIFDSDATSKNTTPQKTTLAKPTDESDETRNTIYNILDSLVGEKAQKEMHYNQKIKPIHEVTYGKWNNMVKDIKMKNDRSQYGGKTFTEIFQTDGLNYNEITKHFQNMLNSEPQEYNSEWDDPQVAFLCNNYSSDELLGFLNRTQTNIEFGEVNELEKQLMKKYEMALELKQYQANSSNRKVLNKLFDIVSKYEKPPLSNTTGIEWKDYDYNYLYVNEPYVDWNETEALKNLHKNIPGKTQTLLHDDDAGLNHQLAVYYMTDDERKIYNYCHRVYGKEGAGAYFNAIKPELLKRRSEEKVEADIKFAKEHPGEAAVGSLISTPINFYGALNTGFDTLFGTKTDVNDPVYDIPRSKKATLEGLTEDKGWMEQLLISAGMSIGEDLVTLPFGGGGFSVFLSSSSAASDSAYDALQRGASPGQAFARGVEVGTVDFFLDKIGLGKLKSLAKSGKKGMKAAVLGIAGQSGFGFAEEGITSIINNVADDLILGEKSDFNIRKNEYLKKNYSEKEAEKAAFMDIYVQGAFEEGLAGLIAEGAMGAGATAINSISNAGNKAVDNTETQSMNDAELDLPTAEGVKPKYDFPPAATNNYSLVSFGKSNESGSFTQKIIENSAKIGSDQIFNVDNMSIMDTGKTSESIYNYFKSIGGVAVNPVLGEVELTKSGAKATTFHGIGNDKFIATAAIKDVIEKGNIIAHDENWKERGYDTYIIAGRGKVNNGDSIVGVIIKSYPDGNMGNKFYLHEVIKIGDDSVSLTENPLHHVSDMAVDNGHAAIDNPQHHVSDMAVNVNGATNESTPTNSIQQNGSVVNSNDMQNNANEFIDENGNRIVLSNNVPNHLVNSVNSINQRTGLNIRFANMYDADGKLNNQFRGMFAGDTIVISEKATKQDVFRAVAIHELTHSIEGTSQYSDIVNYVIDQKYGGVESKLKQDIANKIRQYEQNNVVLDENDAKAEIIAENVGELIFADDIQSIVESDYTFGQKVYDLITDLIYRLQSKLGIGELNELKNAQRKYRMALDSVRKNGSKNTLSGQYDIYDMGNHKRVVVTNDIVNEKGIDTKSKVKNYINRVYDEIQVDLPNGTTGITYVTERGAREFVYSEYTKRLRNTEMYDKYRMADNIDEIIKAQIESTYEDPKHLRNDDIIGFYRSPIEVQVGNRLYDCELVTGITRDGKEEFYDVVNLNLKNKNEPHPTLANRISVKGRRDADSSNDIVSQKGTNVNNNYMQNTKNDSTYNVGKIKEVPFPLEAQRPDGQAVEEHETSSSTVYHDKSQESSPKTTSMEEAFKKAFGKGQFSFVTEQNPETSENTDVEEFYSEKYNQLVEDYGAIRKGEIPEADVKVPKKTGKGQYVSKFARTFAEAGIMDEQMQGEFEKLVVEGAMSHEVLGNKRAEREAIRKIKEDGFEDAVREFETLVKEGRINKSDVARGQILLNVACQAKDVNMAKKLAVNLSLAATQSGRNVQAFSMLKRMSPDGQLYYLERTVQKINNDLNNKFKGKHATVEIDAELAKKLLNAGTEAEINDAVHELEKNIGKQIPSTLKDKWDALRYLATLGNTRTHIRNILGNATFVPIRGLKNVIGTAMEKTISKENRTKAVLKSKESKVFAEQDWEIMQDAVKGNEGKYNTRQGIEDHRTIFKNKYLELARKLNTDVLEAEDTFFLKRAYEDAFAQAMTARGVTAEYLNSGTKEANVQLSSIRNYALKEAQKATFRDTNAFSEMVSNMRFREGQFISEKAADVGNVFVDGVLPFKKTPANILVRGVEYSPIGLAKGLVNLGRSVRNENITASKAIDEIASGLTGTGIAGLGILLASLGILVVQPDEDDEVAGFMRMNGSQNYALNINGHTYTIDWLAPTSLPLFVGAETYNAIKNTDKFTLSAAFDALTRIADPAFELSCLSGVQDALESIKYSEGNAIGELLSDMALSYVMQGLPTIGGQIARTIDNTKRNAYYKDKNSDLPYFINSFISQAAAKIPGATYLLPEKVDRWGRVEKYGSLPERALENFVSPGYYSNDKSTETDKKLMDLYEKTGDNSILPDVASKSFKEDEGIKYLSADEYVEYSKKRGSLSYDYVTEFLNGTDVDNLEDSIKTDIINDLYSYANALAKTEVSDYTLAKKYEKVQLAEKAGISPVKYFTLSNSGVAGFNEEDIREYEYRVQQGENPETVINDLYQRKVDSMEQSEVNKEYSEKAESLITEFDYGTSLELSNIYNSYKEENPDASTIGVPQASKTFTYKGTKHELTPEQYADLQNRYNTAYYENIADIVNNSNLTEAEKYEQISEIRGNVRDDVKQQFAVDVLGYSNAAEVFREALPKGNGGTTNYKKSLYSTQGTSNKGIGNTNYKRYINSIQNTSQGSGQTNYKRNYANKANRSGVSRGQTNYKRMYANQNSDIGFKNYSVTNYNDGSHKGMDFAVPEGTAVQSTTAGKVIEVLSLKDSYGKYVVVRDNDGNYHYYAHLSGFNCKIGDTVNRGTVIGYSGNTGNSTGPHLHYEVRSGNNYSQQLNPQSFL